ncbi:hypothetical protein GPECTOR_402g236 [Gonium pectorale]|uniref:Uncharacterized protein n=1 Tax=Gonium pectorale TaxID=33097 RepID=A0A150FVB0_GONPE|nr:hypothetical protein GPECTOR_402g236 [Gonium pectorale]|eukprot:KXZ41544.1 hypothetical protein GPECTOR_402g236 [Gonium pectorale]
MAEGAVEGGQLPVLEWAVEALGASVYDIQLAKTAAGRSDLETLRWLQQHGCPLDGMEVVKTAVVAGNDQLLKWGVDLLEPAVTSPALMDTVAASGSMERMAWLRERVCPLGRLRREVAQESVALAGGRR